MKIEAKTFLVIIGLSISLVVKGQITPPRLEQYIVDEDKLLTPTILSPEESQSKRISLSRSVEAA